MIAGIIIGVIVLTLLVVAHEFGHALVARRYGTTVKEFGVGFPPKLWSKTLPKSVLGDDVEYSINWLPLGGFVRMQGEHDEDNKLGDYGRMTFWQKTQVLLAGVAVNWMLAALILTILAWVGMPKILPQQFSVAGDAISVRGPIELVAVTPDMPAAKAGLRAGDIIVRFARVVPETPESLSTLAAANKGKTVDVVYERAGKQEKAAVALRTDNHDKKGYLGAGPSQRELMRATWSAPIVGVGTAMQMTVVTLQGLGDMVWNGVSGIVMKLIPDKSTQVEANKNLASVGNNVAGPLAIFGVIFPAAEKAGFAYILMIAAVISLTLAVMNALPIPALDGGRWFVTALYRLLKKPLTADAEDKIHGTGFMLLMLLVVAITIGDIGKIFS